MAQAKDMHMRMDLAREEKRIMRVSAAGAVLALLCQLDMATVYSHLHAAAFGLGPT